MGGVFETILDILKLGRFHFLFGGLLLYVLGAVVALEMGYDVGFTRALFGYLVFAPAHLSVSYSNDLYDMEADVHNPGSPFSGGSGVLQKRPELRSAALFISVFLIVLSVVLSAVFALVYSLSVLFVLLVLLGALLGWFYTAPPLRLSYRGLGEISTALTVGILVAMYGFLAVTGTLRAELLVFIFPMGLSGLFFIFNVQTPDIEADIAGGKRTWVTRVGRKGSFTILFFLVLFQVIYYGIASLLPLDLGGVSMVPFFLLSLVPLAGTLPGLIAGTDERETGIKHATLSMLTLFIFLGGLDLIFLFVV